MKVVVNKSKEPDYPFIGKSKTYDVVVLFTSPSTGVVIGDMDRTWPLGEYSDSWQDDNFEPFTGSIILTND